MIIVGAGCESSVAGFDDVESKEITSLDGLLLRQEFVSAGK